MLLTKEQKGKFIENFQAGDILGFEYLTSIGYKVDQTLLDLNDKYGWDDSFPSEKLDLYTELKVSLLKEIKVYHLLG